MRRVRAAWARLLAAALVAASAGRVGLDPAAARAADPAPPAVADDADAILTRALELERQRKWTAAIEAYERALEHWPGRAEFRHRLRLCESHVKLSRRYQDRSFRDVLLRLSRDRALALYDEVLERIAAHYVEPVPLEPLVRRGFDNLDVALRDNTAFLDAHAPGADPARVRQLRDALRARRDRLVVRTRDEAESAALGAADLAARMLRLPAPAVLLEFTYGACDALPDDYSSCLTPDKLDDLFAMIDGNFVGLGVELKLDDKGLKLVGVIRGGPAFEAGLKAGDRITHVNSLPIAGQTLDEAAGRLQGEEKSQVGLTVLRPDGSTRSLRLTRRAVEVQSVAQAKIVDPAAGIAYVQLSGFQKSSTEELMRALDQLRLRGMTHLILDLRGNPGGLLNVAVEIADLFLDRGVIVSTRGRGANQNAVYSARPGMRWTVPLIVLIDRDSASASEILAGALKDLGRARVVGERSFGKGSVQSIFPLRTAPAGLKLTTAKFYSPTNRSYSEQGVDPDVPVVVRAAARPAGADLPPPTPDDFGDPARDPVLQRALRLARAPRAAAG